MRYLDEHPDIVNWASEEFFVPYRSPIDGKWHRYFPDFWIKKKSNEVIVIEVKPASQTKAPKVQKSRSRRYLYEVKTWGINQAKWKAATEYCKDRGWLFKIMTEKELGI